MVEGHRLRSWLWRTTSLNRAQRRLHVIILTGSLMAGTSALAGPQGEAVVGGSATVTRPNATTTVINQTSDRAVINWSSFNIAANEKTQFIQPSSSSVALNRVMGGGASQILGQLSANGQVYIVNPNGVVFGRDSRVDVSALVASTHDIKTENFMAGNLKFDIPGNPNARIINQGSITAKDGGLVAFVAPGVENSGVIQARLGKVALASGNAFTLDLYGDDLVLLAADAKVVQQLLDENQNPLQSLVSNSGTIKADGGRVLMTANAAKGIVDSVINMSGVVEAKTIDQQGGTIILKGGDGDVKVSGTLDASGEGAAGGGEVRAITEGRLTVTETGKVLAEGGTQGGDGGFIALAGGSGLNQAGIMSVMPRSATGIPGWYYTGDDAAFALGLENPNLTGQGKAPANGAVFEANLGQASDGIQFLANNGSQVMALSQGETALANLTESGQADPSMLRWSPLGGSLASPLIGEEQSNSTVTYVTGGDPSKWISNVPFYRKVRQEGIYQGVDLVHYQNAKGQFEYDFVVKPGADPSQVRLDFSKMDKVAVLPNGDLGLTIGDTTFIQKAPLSYQDTGAGRSIVPARYVVGEDKKVGVGLGKYDKMQSIIIDPAYYLSSYNSSINISGVPNILYTANGLMVPLRNNLYDFMNMRTSDVLTVRTNYAVSNKDYFSVDLTDITGFHGVYFMTGNQNAEEFNINYSGYTLAAYGSPNVHYAVPLKAGDNIRAYLRKSADGVWRKGFEINGVNTIETIASYQYAWNSQSGAFTLAITGATSAIIERIIVGNSAPSITNSSPTVLTYKSVNSDSGKTVSEFLSRFTKSDADGDALGMAVTGIDTKNGGVLAVHD